MREKIISLAKGNFTYEMPELVLPDEPLAFSVVAGEHQTYSFTIANGRKSKIKGFGAVEDTHIDFLPFFDGEEIELTLEVNAEELRAGERLQGELLVITDCGESGIPYDIEVTAPLLMDEQGPIRDYHVLRERIEANPEHGVDLFLSESFRENFLYRDEDGRLTYDYLIRKNTKLQAMEEFLVARKKKKPIRFEISHAVGDHISYELNGVDIQDTLRIEVNTWGHTGIRVISTADFIIPGTHILWTDEFEQGKDFLEFTIAADKVPNGRRFGKLILQTPYERKVVTIDAHNQTGEKERKIRRARKAVIATMLRMYLAYQEKRITRQNFREFLRKNRDVIEKTSGTYKLAVSGYISIILREEENILAFFREAEKCQLPPIGAHVEEVENYITIEFIKTIYTKRDEDKNRLLRFIEGYEENGYQTANLTYMKLLLDERYHSLRLLERDVRAQLEAGSSSPFLYSVMLQAYCEDATLIAVLDKVTVNTINYGLKLNLITKEDSMAVSFLAERLPSFDPMVFEILQKLYNFFVMTDTLHAICSMLIRNEIRDKKYFSWFDKGVSKHLRLTDLYEYYMYTMDFEKITRLPDSVLMYFQYENHLNDTCKAYLYAYIVKHKGENPDIYQCYLEQMEPFVYRQLSHHKITQDLAVLYKDMLGESQIMGQAAKDLPHIMFRYGVWCSNKAVDGVVVVHRECQGETYYPFQDGYAQISLYTPNTQLFFLDERGRYYAESVDYRMERLIDMDDYAWQCYREGADFSQLLIYLAVKAERAARLSDEQVRVLYRVLKQNILRDSMQQKVLFRLFDLYREEKNMVYLLEMLNLMEPEKVKRERLGDVASDCIYQGMYHKAAKMLCRGGMEQCEPAALAMLVAELIRENEGEFEPLLVKWALYLFRQKYYDKEAMAYLLHYYMGDVKTLSAIYRMCRKMPEVEIKEEDNERLLAQILFAGEDITRYTGIYQEYYEHGDNRMLVKAYLSELAYEYVVEKIDLTEELFVKIEKEALYEKDLVMVLATLMYYRTQESFSGKQKEFVELNLERYAGEGIILAFMKYYIGKVKVPYEIENTVLIQYYSGSGRDVFLCEEGPDGKKDAQPMRQIFPGVFTRELLLFEGEEKRCYIYEEESGEKTETMTVRRPEQTIQTQGFFGMVNQMIQAEQHHDEVSYNQIKTKYEKARYAAEHLFEIH